MQTAVARIPNEVTDISTTTPTLALLLRLYNRLPTMPAPLKEILGISGPLTLRSIIIALRMVPIKIFFYHKNPALLAEFAEMATLDNLIFVTIFRSIRGISPLVSQATAKNPADGSINLPEVGVVYRHSILFSLLMMVPISMICLFAPVILKIFQLSDKAIEDSTFYFRTLFFAYSSDLFLRIQARVLTGLKKTTPPLFADILEAGLLILMCYLLINGQCGFSEQGVNSYPIAYTIASFIALAVNTMYLSTSTFGVYQLFHFHTAFFSKDKFKQLLKNCLWPGADGFVEQSSQITITSLASKLGHSALIALEINKIYGQIVSFFTIANSIATSILVAKKVKEKSHDYRVIPNTNYLLNMGFSTACFFSLPVTAPLFLNLMLMGHPRDPNLVDLLLNALYVQGVIEIANSVRISGSGGALAGCFDTIYPVASNTAFVFMLNSLLAVFATSYFTLSAPALYATQMTGFFLSAGAIFERWYHRDTPEDSWFNQGILFLSSCKSRFFSSYEDTAAPMATEEVRSIEIINTGPTIAVQ